MVSSQENGVMTLISKKSRQLSEAMAKQGIIKPEDTAVYAYGLELIISTVISVAAVLILSAVFSRPLAGVLYLVAFIPLRSTAGGYHATRHLYCLITFSVSFMVLLLGAIYLSPYIKPLYLLIISVVNLIAVFILSPIGTPKKPMTDEKRRQNRKRSIIISIIFVLITASCFLLSPWFLSLFTYFAMGQFAFLISLLVAVRLKR
jgi:accessory gene regulator B